jgi:murein DD-endopeptidase MepM/ murein hydrolase activator NlpD
VLAASGGKIVFIGKSLPGYGDTVIIDHDNGIATVYSNVQSIKQDPGKSIKQGEAIASVRKNDFFHFEVRQGAKPVNPMYYLP